MATSLFTIMILNWSVKIFNKSGFLISRWTAGVVSTFLLIDPFFRQAEVCMDRIGKLETLCHSYLPTDVESIKNHLEHIQEVRKSILEALMVALSNGTQLLDVLRDLQTQGTLDSRPGHNQNSISLGTQTFALIY